MHAYVYVLHDINDETKISPINEETLLNDIPIADYINEEELCDSHYTKLVKLLTQLFGPTNITSDKATKRVTISKSGIEWYFTNLLLNIKNTVDLAKSKEIKEFIISNDRCDWQFIKSLLDKPYVGQFYIQGFTCGSVTDLAYYVYDMMDFWEKDTYTLELLQVFDYHY